jgi:hypothetical protein
MKTSALGRSGSSEREPERGRKSVGPLSSCYTAKGNGVRVLARVPQIPNLLPKGMGPCG